MSNTSTKLGDHVQLLDGDYEGCILTLLRIEAGEYVCERSTWPYEVKAQGVRLYRSMPECELAE